MKIINYVVACHPARFYFLFIFQFLLANAKLHSHCMIILTVLYSFTIL